MESEETKINPVLYKKAKDKFNLMTETQKKELQSSMSWFFLTDQMKTKIRLEIQAKMKRMDIASVLFAIIGTFTNIFASYFYITYSYVQTDNLMSIIVTGNETVNVKILRAITSVTTLILLVLIYLHYKTRLTFLIFKQGVELSSTLVSTRLIIPLIAELIICCIHTPPGMNNVRVFIPLTGTNPAPSLQVDVDLLISCFVPIRVYLLFRLYAFYSNWADDRAEKICNECNASGGVAFAVKAELKESPYFAVGCLLIMSILICGYGLRNIEVAFMQNKKSNEFQDWTYIWNGFWCIVITILTVGYGDYYPQTYFGRIIVVIACLWGTFLISLMVISLTNSVDFTPQEEKAYDEIKKDQMEFNFKYKAMAMIRACHSLKNKIEAQDDTSVTDVIKCEQNAIALKIAEFKYKKSIQEFRLYRKSVISKTHEISTETILSRLNQCVSDDVEELLSLSRLHVYNLIEHIKLSKTFQEQIKTHVNNLDKLTKGFYNCIKTDNSDDGSSVVIIDKTLSAENTPNIFK